MKKLTFLLSVLLVMVVLLQSCTKEQIEVSETSVELSTSESTAALALKGGRDCEILRQEMEIFLPDTKEEIAFLETIEEAKELNEEQIAIYSRALGFEDVTEFEAFFVRLVKSDCDFSLQGRPEGEYDDCGDRLYNCIDASIRVAIISLVNLSQDIHQVFYDFVFHAATCAVQYKICKDKY